MTILAVLIAFAGLVAYFDFRQGRIPNWLTASLLVAGFVYHASQTGLAPWPRVVDAAVAFGGFYLFRELYFRLRGQHGLGLGDVKLISAAAIWIGLLRLPDMILVAALAALSQLVALRLLRNSSLNSTNKIAFGPHLMIGMIYSMYTILE